MRQRPLRIALVWARPAAEHADKVAAVAARLGVRVELVYVALADFTSDYVQPSEGTGDEHDLLQVLFPRATYEEVPILKRGLALWRATARSDLVLMGIGYGQAEALAVSWLLRLAGKRVVMMNDTKFEDRRRTPLGELVKRWVLSCYSAAIVGGARSVEYFRFLGFRRRPILPGCDTLSAARLRAAAAPSGGAAPRFEDREFVFVGRFIAVKNLPLLLEGYARYVAATGPSARRLCLVGDGPLDAQLREQAAQLGIAHLVEFAGFASSAEVARRLAKALALVLPSYSETWGLVLNEAMILGIPQIVSEQCGARDTLLRNLISGVAFEAGSSESLAAALSHVAGDEARWRAMAHANLERSWLADVAVFADSVEALVDRQPGGTGGSPARYLAEFQGYWGRSPF